MTNKEIIEKFKQEHCSKCNKDVDCTITITVDNRGRCSEQEN